MKRPRGTKQLLRRAPLLSLVAFAVVAVGCPVPPSSDDAGFDSGPGGGPDSGPLDAGAPDGGACTSPNSAGALASSPSWCALDRLLDESLAAPVSLPGYAFVVYTTRADGTRDRVYARAAGNFSAPDGGAGTPAGLNVAAQTASAGKFLTGITLLHAKHLLAGTSAAFTLDETVAVLGCAGLDAGRNAITLSQLMRQTAGLDSNDNACLRLNAAPLNACACRILGDPPAGNFSNGPAGSQFVYGSNSFTVAAAIVEKHLQAAASPTTVRALFDSLGQSLGVVAGEASPPPLTNTFAAAYRMSAEAYAGYLALAAPGPGAGTYQGVRYVDAADLIEMRTAYGDLVQLTESPFLQAGSCGSATPSPACPSLAIRYGLHSWVSCTALWQQDSWPDAFFSPALDYASCPKRIQHSLGAHGFMPWVSFPDSAGSPAYVAVLATYNAAVGRVSVDSYNVFSRLAPQIDRALLGR